MVAIPSQVRLVLTRARQKQLMLHLQLVAGGEGKMPLWHCALYDS